MRHFLVIAALLAPPAAADPSGAIDYEALFDANADQVEELMAVDGAQSRWRLQLPGNVTVWADGTLDNRRFAAMDDTASGSVGCLWDIYNQLVVMDASCPGLLNAEQIQQLSSFHTRIGSFVAENTYPPVEADAFWAYWEAANAADPTLQCDALIDGATAQLIGTLISPSFDAVVTAALATPRLPVGNPCF